MDTIFPTDIKEAAGRLGLRICPEQLSAVNAFVKMGLSYSRKKQKTLEHNGFVSVYDERMTFENVQAIAQKLSAILKARVFFSSVYDDDVFLFGLCEDGETISLHISGNCEAYVVWYNARKLLPFAVLSNASMPSVYCFGFSSSSSLAIFFTLVR